MKYFDDKFCTHQFQGGVLGALGTPSQEFWVPQN